MNIIEREALKFNNREFYVGSSSLAEITSRLSAKIYDFNRDRDKLEFLRILKELNIKEKNEHAKVCSNGCSLDELKETGLFVIDQEIDDIKSYYEYEAPSKEKFSSDEEQDLNSRLNEIIQKLDSLDLGQEIIFEELNELRIHFNLGKKNWFQLAKGKLVDLTINKVLKETIIKEIYTTLSNGFDSATKFLEVL